MSLNTSQRSSKPDLDENINVVDEHDRLSNGGSATSREKKFIGAGNESMPLWLVTVSGVSCLVVAVLAASAIFGSGNWPGMGETVREDYVRAEAPGGGDKGPKPTEALMAFSARGQKLYSSKCAGCHNPGGTGDGVNYPSLVGSKWVVEDSQKLAMIIINGLQGPTSTGKVYGAGIMPAQGTGLTAEDLAGLMTYVRNSWGNEAGDIISPEMAANAMEISQSREKPGSPITAGEIASTHSKNLEGAVIEPTLMVNPATLEPIQ